MIETQSTIGQWGRETLGPITDYEVACKRIAVECLEAADAARTGQPIGPELADIAIIVMNIAEQAGIDLQTEIDAKMAINRARTWVKDGRGNGQHA